LAGDINLLGKGALGNLYYFALGDAAAAIYP
jgi:hypothetical protein